MKIAAVAYEAGEGDTVDALLADIAQDLKARGAKLAGCVQLNEPRAGQDRCAMILIDLATGERLDVSSDPSRDGTTCRLNSYALEDAAGRIAATIGPDVDFVILNRFGKQEAARAGFRAVLETAVAHELPLLAGLNASYRPKWEGFTNSYGDILPPQREAVQAWALKALTGDKA